MEQTRLLFILEEDLRIQLLIYKILRVHNAHIVLGLESAADKPNSQTVQQIPVDYSVKQATNNKKASRVVVIRGFCLRRGN